MFPVAGELWQLKNLTAKEKWEIVRNQLFLISWSHYRKNFPFAYLSKHTYVRTYNVCTCVMSF